MALWTASLAGAALIVAAPATALTVHTSAFITSPAHFTSFEGLGPVTAADNVTSYSEDGIDVSFVGTGVVWSLSQAAPDGQYSWYADGGGYGYTRISFADATSIQFLASSGFFAGPVDLFYEVLLDGALIGTGSITSVPTYGSGWNYYGFSGATFDEIRLQVQSGGSRFDPLAYEAGAYDAISIGVVPEPASWAMMIAGFGLVGALARRRSSLAIAAR